MEQPDDYFEAERDEMLAFIPEGIGSLLDVGCGRGAFLGRLTRSRPALRVAGMELDAAAAGEARARGFTITVGAYPRDAVGLGPFDCVVFNDVLEHIEDPWAALEATKALLNPGGCVVASLPNLRNIETIRDLVIGGDFRYRPQGVLDVTHLRFFTRASARRMFADGGYRVERDECLNRLGSRRLRAVNSVVSIVAPGLRAEGSFRQFAVVARWAG